MKLTVQHFDIRSTNVVDTLIEERIHETGPSWFHEAPIFQTIDNYLRSGIRFVYVQAALVPAPEPSPSSS